MNELSSALAQEFHEVFSENYREVTGSHNQEWEDVPYKYRLTLIKTLAQLAEQGRITINKPDSPTRGPVAQSG